MYIEVVVLLPKLRDVINRRPRIEFDCGAIFTFLSIKSNAYPVVIVVIDHFRGSGCFEKVLDVLALDESVGSVRFNATLPKLVESFTLSSDFL